MVVGGAAGKHVRKADLLITVETTDEALEAASCSSSITARTRITWSAPTISWSGWESRKFARRPCMRRRREKRKLLRRPAAGQGAFERRVAGARQNPPTPRSLYRSNHWKNEPWRLAAMNWIRSNQGTKTFRCAKAGAYESATTRSPSSTWAIVLPRSTTTARIAAARCATASSAERP